jgi:hypothetical protein
MGSLQIIQKDKNGNIKKDIEITRDEIKGKIITEDKLKKEQKNAGKRTE